MSGERPGPAPNYVARARRRESTRQRILATAADVFYRRGIAPVSMDDVADEAGISKPTLYNHFRSKEELVAESLEIVDDIHFAWFTEQADRYVRLHGTLPALAVFDVLTKWFATKSFHGCTFINSSLQVGATNERAQLAVLRHKTRTREWLRDLCERSGITEPDRDEVAGQLMILMEGAIVTAAVEGDKLAAAKAQRAARTLVTAALSTAVG
jgi:AcrR family transcriptional regulator